MSIRHERTAVRASNQLLTTSVAERGGVVVLSLVGSIDAASGKVLDAVVEDVLSRQVTALVVELSAVDFLGSPALRVLVTLQESLSNFAVVADDPVVVRPIQITGLDELLPLYPTLDDALAAVSTRIGCQPVTSDRRPGSAAS
jgi:anti-sigma B factor antagonist